jgi:inhibitor of cysteine peptidase
LVIYFQHYEHFPYAAGIQKFVFPYTDLKPYLRTEFSFLYKKPVTLEPGRNTMKVGELGNIILKGNASTGYTWHYYIDEPDIVRVVSETEEPTTGASHVGEIIVGAPGIYKWQVRALKAGTATITFKYYRSWEGEESATEENTLVYNITVKND